LEKIMGITKTIGSILGEIVGHPTQSSYILGKGDAKVVIRSGGDLTGQDLSGLNLRGLNLRNTTFQGANLSGVDLSGAHLEGADLRDADLTGTLLSGAHLENAKFDPETLSHAIFESTPTGLPEEMISMIKEGAQL
jgi:hypothetical protein